MIRRLIHPAGPGLLCLSLLLTSLAQAQTAPRQTGIRQVDFLNFTYRPDCLGVDQSGKGEAIRVRKGTYTRGSVDDPSGDRVYFEVRQVVYGDLTGDGQEEAVVLTLCNTGGTGQFTDGIIFTLREGKPTPLLTLGMGDRADGGISGVTIEAGLLKVSRYATQNGGACCPEFVDTQAYRLSGAKLVEAGRPVRREYRDEPPSSAARRVQFERGRTTAVLQGSTEASDEYLLRARAGQTMIVHVAAEKKNAAVQVIADDGAALISGEVNDWSGKLPGTGDYRIVVKSTGGVAKYTLEITVR